MHELTHASFFSGVGGLDLGLERAGWRTVSFSEIDPYASAVLAERWPGIPNLGDILRLDRRDTDDGESAADSESGEWYRATLWSGGFPCQDLSVAGKRVGFGGERSSLAFAFLNLVERHRPPAILLENVPGLLSSHRGRDFGTLLDRLAQLRYGWAYRILDARHFGVPQRRRRVFIVALDIERGLGAERAAAVLSVGTRCPRHPAAGQPAGPAASDGLAAGISRALSTSQERIDADTESFVVGSSPDPGGMRAADGLARRVDDLAPTLLAPSGGQRSTDLNNPLVFTKSRRAQNDTDDETLVGDAVMPTLNAFDVGDARTTAAILGGQPHDDPLLPLGLDSHRYRCCGNGVVSSVAEWIGLRLAAVVA